jgi:hypothetical protein
MKTASHRRTMMLWVLALAAGLVFAAAGTAWAKPFTETTIMKHFTETFTTDPASGDDFLACGGEPYTITVNAKVVSHLTASGIEENGELIPPWHTNGLLVGRFVAIPADGTGPTYAGHFKEGLEHSNMNKNNETFTNHYLVIARGSDGSRLHQNLLFRYSLNADGKMNFVIRLRDCAF